MPMTSSLGICNVPGSHGVAAVISPPAVQMFDDKARWRHTVGWYIVILFPFPDPEVHVTKLLRGEISDSDWCIWPRSG